MIPASDFVVNYRAKSLDAAPRYTHILHLYPYEVRERIKAGLWRDVPLGLPDEGGDDEDGLLRFYEQHRMADLDEDGIPEHYVVTTNDQGVVARIAPCFDVFGVYVNVGDDIVKRASDLEPQELEGADYPIVRIERNQYFTKYGFIPSPDGAFYDIGFGALLDDLTAAIDGTLNRLLDAGTLQNAQGGFLGAGVNIKGGNMKFAIGEWKRVDTGAGTLRDNILPLQMPGPSPVLFQLLGMLLDAAKQITSVQDILTGANQGANTPATTVLAQIEQGQKVMNGIFKRIHRAFGCELRILRRLNRDYLNDEEYFQLNDENEPEVDEEGQPVMREPMAIGRADYEDGDLDVVPVSDPTIVSDAQRMAKAQALLPFRGDPLVNQGEIAQRYFEALGMADIKKLMTPADAGPNPMLLIEGMSKQLEKMKLAIEEMSKRGATANLLMDAAGKAAALGLLDDAAALAGEATNIGVNSNEPIDRAGDVSGMEGQPADAGVSDLLGGPPTGANEGMGEGSLADGSAASSGGPTGPVSGPVA
jgi:chaperonin GroES